MRYPTLTPVEMTQDVINVFGGYNHNLNIQESEFYDMRNMTSDFYPLLSPRETRENYFPESTSHNINGIISKEKLCYVDRGIFYIDNVPVEDFELTDTPKQLVSMGAYVVIFPDKKYINTLSLSDKGSMEEFYSTSGEVVFSLTKQDGEEFGESYISDTPPSNTSLLWSDTSGDTPVLKQYNATTAMWVSIPTTYIKISAPGIGEKFNQDDGVTISGIDIPCLEDLNSTMMIQGKGDDYIVVIGVFAGTGTFRQSGIEFKVERRIPIMDYVIESNNRLWGCRYGTALNGETVNEIYASKLGDFKNWSIYQNVTTDSYAVSCGTDGAFTGAINYGGYPIFFKEDCYHRIYGDYPANYRVQSIPCRGVEKGSHKSLAIVNETLFYKSRDGICALSGQTPTVISTVFGNIKYKNGVGGASENKYYICLENENAHHIFVYDVLNGLWHKEDNLEVIDFCKHNGVVYASVGDNIKVLNKESDEVVEWYAETGNIGISEPATKFVSRLIARLSIAIGAELHIYIQYDSSGQWEHLYTYTGHSLNSFDVSIKPKRCDHFKLKLVGKGKAKLFSLSKVVETGSDYR